MVPGLGRPMKLLRGAVDRFRVRRWLNRCVIAFRRIDSSYEFGRCEVIVIRICSSSHNFYVFGVYRDLDLSDKISHYLLTAIAKVQSVDRKTSFLFVDDMHTHHEEWPGSSATNLNGKAASDFASSSGCEKMVTEPTHIDGGGLDLVLTDAPDVAGVRVGSPVGTSDHSAVFIDVVLEQHKPHLVCRQEFILRTLWSGSWLEGREGSQLV